MRSLICSFITFLMLCLTPAQAQECPECAPIDAWFAENNGACGYHGNRLPSICAADPECVQWNLTCNAKRAEHAACIARCMAGDPPPPPPPPQSQAPELDEFDRDVAELERTGYLDGEVQQSPEWCRQARDRHARRDPEMYAGGTIGQIVATQGSARVDLCTGGVVDATYAMPIRLGDCVETGPGGKVSIVVYDTDAPRRHRRSYSYVGLESKVCFDSLPVDQPEQADTSLLNLIRGSVKAIFLPWKRNTIFSVKAGTTVIGIRGSEVIVRREPSDGSIQAAVIEGHAWLGNRETREIRQLEAGQWAQDTTGGMGPVQHLPREQWDAVLVQDGLDLEGSTSGLASNGCNTVAGNWRWPEGVVYAFATNGRWTEVDGMGTGTWSCSVNHSNDTEILFAPDPGIGKWSVRAVIAPDGQSFSGQRENGVDVDAVRVR